MPIFGDKDYNYNLAKEGDSAFGETIVSIFYTTTQMILYRTEGKLINSFSDHVDRFSILNAKKLEIDNLLQYKSQKTNELKQADPKKELERLYDIYAPQIAHAYQMCYFEKYEEGMLIADGVKKNIESRITSQAQFTYTKYYLRYLLIALLTILGLLFWDSIIASQKSLKFQNDILWHFYIAGAGIIGSFLSAKEKIASRKIDFNIPIKSAILDVKIRIFLGGIFGILLVWLIYSKFIMGFTTEHIEGFFNGASKTPLQIITVLIVAIIGGFSERLVPDTLQSKLLKIKNQNNSQEDQTKTIAKTVAQGKKQEDKKTQNNKKGN